MREPRDGRRAHPALSMTDTPKLLPGAAIGQGAYGKLAALAFRGGLAEFEDHAGERAGPIAKVARRAADVAAFKAGVNTLERMEDLDTSALDWAAHVMQERTDESRS